MSETIHSINSIHFNVKCINVCIQVSEHLFVYPSLLNMVSFFLLVFLNSAQSSPSIVMSNVIEMIATQFMHMNNNCHISKRTQAYAIHKMHDFALI